MDARTEALESALAGAWAVERAMSRLDWPMRLVDVVDKAVVALRLLLGRRDVVDAEVGDLQDGEPALAFARRLAAAYDAVDDVKAGWTDELALAAIDEAVERLCEEFGLDYDDFLYGTGAFAQEEVCGERRD